jgi:hypothetical protein
LLSDAPTAVSDKSRPMSKVAATPELFIAAASKSWSL